MLGEDANSVAQVNIMVTVRFLCSMFRISLGVSPDPNNTI